MTLQEKIEILDGVKDHPNKEKLVFKIDDEWVPYTSIESELLEASFNVINEYLKQG